MKIIRSFRFAIRGIGHCFKSEINFRVHLFLALAAILLGIWLHISTTEWLFIMFSIALVLLVEMINTSVEKLCDLVHKDRHPLIMVIKDITAAAVLVSAVASFCAGAIIFLPKMF